MKIEDKRKQLGLKFNKINSLNSIKNYKIFIFKYINLRFFNQKNFFKFDKFNSQNIFDIFKKKYNSNAPCGIIK